MRARAFLLLASVFGASAYGNIIEIKIGGTIENSNLSALPAGQAITITLQYDSNGSPTSIQSQQAFYIDKFKTLRIQSGGYDGTSGLMNFGQIDKYDNLSNSDGIQFRAMAHAQAYQYVAATAVVMPSIFSNNLNQAFDGMYLNLIGNSSSVFSDYALPTAYNLSNFTINYTIAFSDGSAGINSKGAASIVTITDVTQAPEPGSMALLLGAGALGLARRRFRA